MCWFLNDTKVCCFTNAGKIAILKFDFVSEEPNIYHCIWYILYPYQGICIKQRRQNYHTQGVSLKHLKVFIYHTATLDIYTGAGQRAISRL
jgi:hypothetical protein